MKEFERLRRGAHDGRTRKLPSWIYEQAAKYGITDPTTAEALYDRASYLALQSFTAASEIYRRLLLHASGYRPVAPCKRMRTEAMYVNPNRWAAPKPGVGPGKRTRIMTLEDELAKRERFLKMRQIVEEYRHNYHCQTSYVFHIIAKSWHSWPDARRLKMAIRAMRRVLEFRWGGSQQSLCKFSHGTPLTKPSI